MRSHWFSVVALLVAASVPGVAAAESWRGHPSYGEEVIVCESRDGRDQRCPVDTRGGVELVDQRSRSACVEGHSWGWNRRGIWVTRGCRGVFALGGRGYGRDYGRAGPGYGREQYVRCESHEGRYNECGIGRGNRRVEIARQLSRSLCEEGYSWGYGRGGIWVDRGCRADFLVY